ncbi:MAG: flavodoxin family protein [Candidatus Firestonebacteria bacterium]|nr:flavodoxin family protein [Candidatus Firestonebacteria bacterium]
MLILGINGSPRKGGNTDILLERALTGAKAAGAETQRINLGELRFSPCLSCENARKDGVCKINDDMQKVSIAIAKADGIIIASPVYFGSVSAQIKMMIDRFQCYWAAIFMHKTLKNPPARPGAFICVAANSKKEFFENSKEVVKNLFFTLNVKYSKELLCAGVEGKGEVLKKTECLQKAEKVGFELVKKEGDDGCQI